MNSEAHMQRVELQRFISRKRRHDWRGSLMYLLPSACEGAIVIVLRVFWPCLIAFDVFR